MPLDPKALVSKVLGEMDAILQHARERYDSTYVVTESYAEIEKGFSYMSVNEAAELSSRLLSAIYRYSRQDSAYRHNADKTVAQYGTNSSIAVDVLHGILQALRTDYAAGYLYSVTELVQADIFGDFLEMALYLAEQKYKDAAAVIAGSVLEEHLRKLCLKHGVPIDKNTAKGIEPKTMGALNDDLLKASAYAKLDHNLVMGWIKIRNGAAHGNYNAYTPEQVDLMLQGLPSFLRDNPI
jgi:hypothetical protein